MESMRYDAIFEWNMTAEEAEAYKLAVLYEKEFLKLFGGTETLDGQGFRRNTIPKRGDPRKSNLFRYCWKLRRETRGLLTSDQYRTYIIANLMVLNLNKAHIEPNAICGEKAWIRWKLYERWQAKKEAELNSVPPPPVPSHAIVKEIDKTKKFLFEKCEGSPTVEKIKSFIDNGFFRLWVMTGKVTPYYVIDSPFVQRAADVNRLAEECSFDPTLMRLKITPDVRSYLEREFPHEYAVVG